MQETIETNNHVFSKDAFYIKNEATAQTAENILNEFKKLSPAYLGLKPEELDGAHADLESLGEVVWSGYKELQKLPGMFSKHRSLTPLPSRQRKTRKKAAPVAAE